MKTLKYGAGALLSSAALVAGFAAPVAASPWSHQDAPLHITKTTNTNSNNTLTVTTTDTTTVTDTHTNTHNFTNSGILQVQLPSVPLWQDGGGYGSAGSQTAVQGNNSGAYNVKLHQEQSTTQSSSNGNMALGQANFSTQSNTTMGGGKNSSDTNTQTNSNTQSLSQSNSTSQTMSVNQSAQGVVVQ